jgi:hypothetical protein
VTCPSDIIQGAKALQNEAPLAGRRAARRSEGPPRNDGPSLVQRSGFEQLVAWLRNRQVAESHVCMSAFHLQRDRTGVATTPHDREAAWR